MKWKGKELIKLGDISNAMTEIHASNNQEDADEFMRLVREFNPEHGDENIGYLTGYFSQETAEEMRKLFGVVHPIFGTRSPTTKEAFQAGKNLAGAGRALYGLDKK